MLAAAHTNLDPGDVFDQLLARERLGSTALGNGVAIPHCRLDACERAYAGFVTLATPIDFDAPDDRAVDLMFVLVVPAEGREVHLKILAELARVFASEDNCARLRTAATDEELHEILLSMLRG